MSPHKKHLQESVLSCRLVPGAALHGLPLGYRSTCLLHPQNISVVILLAFLIDAY